jgi:hypothetical protein
MLFSNHRIGWLVLITAMLLARGVTAADTGTGATPSIAPKVALGAELFGHSVTRATASYRAASSDRGQRRLEVAVQGAIPLQRFIVSIEGRRVGFLQADLRGHGALTVDGSRLPGLVAGHTITVGKLAGAFYDHSRRMQDRTQWYRVRAELAGDRTHTLGNVKYVESFARGRLVRTVGIELRDAKPETIYDVLIDGSRVAQLKTNEHGFGLLEMSTADAVPMPRLFPTIVPGAKISIGPVSGVARR